MPTAAQLRKLYIDEQMPERDVGKVLHRSVGVIHRLIIEYDIPLRGKSQSRKAALLHGRIPEKSRELSPFWKGENHRYIDRYGYVWVRKPENYPYRHGKRAMIQEHILVWEQIHGRELPKGWSVHHVNANKQDNRPRNLLGVSSNSEHKKRDLSLQRIRAQRILELEAEVEVLTRALQDQQMIFRVSEN
jgi:hypothetical protein